MQGGGLALISMAKSFIGSIAVASLLQAEATSGPITLSKSVCIVALSLVEPSREIPESLSANLKFYHAALHQSSFILPGKTRGRTGGEGRYRICNWEFNADVRRAP